MFFLFVDIELAMTPFCKTHFNTICAGVLPYSLAIFCKISKSKIFPWIVKQDPNSTRNYFVITGSPDSWSLPVQIEYLNRSYWYLTINKAETIYKYCPTFEDNTIKFVVYYNF